MPTDELLIKRIKSLIIPLFFFFCVDLIIRTVLTVSRVPAYEKLINIFSLRNGSWIVVALFLNAILYNALRRVLKGKQGVLAFAVLLIYSIGMIASCFDVSAEANNQRALIGLGFYYVGYLIGRLEMPQRIIEGTPPIKAAVIFTSLAVLLVGAVWKNDYMVLMYASNYGNPFLFTIKAVSCSLALVSICVVVDHAALLECIGKNSLIMMIISFPVYLSFKAVYNRMLLGFLSSKAVFIAVNII